MATSRWAEGACFVLDCVLVAVVAASVAILVTGGFVIDVASVRIRARTLTNPVLIAAAVLVGRYWLRTHLPFLGLRSLRLDDIGRVSLSWTWRLLHERMAVRRVLGSLIIMAVVVKLAAAWHLPGFFKLPRPVASVFVLGAFILLLSHRTRPSVSAGVLLGVAVAFRFSEAIFVLPALVMLGGRRRWLEAYVVAIGTAATAGLVIGIADLLY